MTGRRENNRRILIFGSGGHAREIACLARDVFAASGGGSILGFVERDGGPALGTAMLSIPVLDLEQAKKHFPGAPCVVAVGESYRRKIIADSAEAAGFVADTLVHPTVVMSEFVHYQPGTVICAGCILTCNIEIGAHVHVNRGVMVSHDTTIGDFATLNPGVRLSGNVRIGPFATLGVGASVIDGTANRPLVIHEGAIVGAQACVIDDVAPSQTVIGVPARPKTPR